MQLKQLLTDDEAVSPVIGVILMVAITVILAAVIGTFVLGLGDQVQDTAPQASFNFDFETNSGDDDQVTITHDGGDSIDGALMNTTIDGAEASSSGDYLYDETTAWYGYDTVSAGTTVTVNTTTNPDWSGEVVRVVWTSETGDDSATLGKATAPN